jgi:hypothetical protein
VGLYLLFLGSSYLYFVDKDTEKADSAANSMAYTMLVAGFLMTMYHASLFMKHYGE